MATLWQKIVLWQSSPLSIEKKCYEMQKNKDWLMFANIAALKICLK